MDSNLQSVLDSTDLRQIDFFLNSYYSFLYLKKNLSDKLNSFANKNSVSIRVIVVCKDNDQFNSVTDFFKPYKNVIVKELSSVSDSFKHLITIIVNKSHLYFLKIDYDSTNRIFSSQLSDSLNIDIVYVLCTFYDNMWNTLEKNLILEKRNIFQQDFVDISSHQLRNPILPIIGFSKTLQSKIKDPEMLDYLDIIIKNAEKLKNIANEILDISKIEANPSKLDFEVFDIDQLLSNIIDDYNQLSKKDFSNIDIVFQGKPNVLIEADREYIKQAFENILNNSYFFTKKNEGNKIMVSILNKKDDENFTTVIIEDEGPGILDDDPERIFTKFYPNSGGAGLGLFISKKIFEIHEGSIIVENRVNDMGAKFTINMPLKQKDLFYPLSQESESINDLKILFIDDFSEDLNYIKEQLKTLGYKIDHFDDPYNAIECFVPKKYFIVFIGINVKGLDGFDLYDDLKKRDKNIKGYFISSNKIYKEAMEFLNKNMMYDHFIYKPISFTTILKILQKE